MSYLDDLEPATNRASSKERFGGDWPKYAELIREYAERIKKRTQPESYKVLKKIEEHFGIKISLSTVRRHIREKIWES